MRVELFLYHPLVSLTSPVVINPAGLNTLTSALHPRMISSKEVLVRTKISRATLNNYIALGLIPPPVVRKPSEPGGPTKLGYFPDWVLDRIERIRQLKATGVRMSGIASHFKEEPEKKVEVTTQPLLDQRYEYVEELIFPAVLVNHNWEIISINKSAEELFFEKPVSNIPTTSKQSIFELFFAESRQCRFSNWREMIAALMSIAKRELAEDSFKYPPQERGGYPFEEVEQIWRDTEILEDRPIIRQPLVLKPFDGQETHLMLFAITLREGTLLFFIPASLQLDQILDLLSGKLELAKVLLLQKVPSPTPLGILAGQLESELHLRTTLPPSEYFDLMNQIILSSHQCFREHGGTPGRSFKEGIVCFFPSASESPQRYLYQALLCAQALRKLVSDLDRLWKLKQAWNNRLRMNMGIHCGSEWLGSIASPLAFEFTAVGDTLTEAIKMSELSQRGAIWASKNVVENLSPGHRERVEFGIRLGAEQQRLVSPGIYSSVRELLNHGELERRALQEISNLAVTEIISVNP